mgnify:CR=1 FL=1
MRENYPMEFKMNVNMDNAAFENMEAQMQDLFYQVRMSFTSGNREGTVRDFNGNTVGQWKISSDSEE